MKKNSTSTLNSTPNNQRIIPPNERRDPPIMHRGPRYVSRIINTELNGTIAQEDSAARVLVFTESDSDYDMNQDPSISNRMRNNT